MGWSEWLARAGVLLFLFLVVVGYATAGTDLFLPVSFLLLVAFAVMLYGIYVSSNGSRSD